MRDNTKPKLTPNNIFITKREISFTPSKVWSKFLITFPIWLSISLIFLSTLSTISFKKPTTESVVSLSKAIMSIISPMVPRV